MIHWHAIELYISSFDTFHSLYKSQEHKVCIIEVCTYNCNSYDFGALGHKEIQQL